MDMMNLCVVNLASAMSIPTRIHKRQTWFIVLYVFGEAINLGGTALHESKWLGVSLP